MHTRIYNICITLLYYIVVTAVFPIPAAVAYYYNIYIYICILYIYIIFSYNSPFHSCSSRRVRLVVMPTNYYRTDELSFRPQEVLIMNELCRMEERRRRRRRVIQKRTTRVNYIYLICIYIYIFVYCIVQTL
jgi:hypothetical protein